MKDEKLFNYKIERVHPEDYEEVRYKKKKEKPSVIKHIHSFVEITKEDEKSYLKYYKCTFCNKENWKFNFPVFGRGFCGKG